MVDRNRRPDHHHFNHCPPTFGFSFKQTEPRTRARGIFFQANQTTDSPTWDLLSSRWNHGLAHTGFSFKQMKPSTQPWDFLPNRRNHGLTYMGFSFKHTEPRTPLHGIFFQADQTMDPPQGILFQELRISGAEKAPCIFSAKLILRSGSV